MIVRIILFSFRERKSIMDYIYLFAVCLMNSSLSRCLLLAIIASVSVSWVFAWDVLNTSVVPSANAQICSPSSTRWLTNQWSAVTLFNLTPAQKLYFEKFTVWANLSSNIVGDIIGATSRNNNDKNNAPSGKCLTNTNHGEWTPEETAGWSTFWSSSSDAFWSFFTNVSLTTSPIAVTDAAKMQEYIRRACGLNLIPDGKIGIKTLNAARICTPPCQGKCGRNTFESLKDKLFYNEEGTKEVHDGSVFTDEWNPTLVMYIDGSKLATIPDGLDLYLMLSGGKVVAKDTWSIASMIEDRGLWLTTTSSSPDTNGVSCDTLFTPIEYNALQTIPVLWFTSPLVTEIDKNCYYSPNWDKTSDQITAAVSATPTMNVPKEKLDQLQTPAEAGKWSSPESASARGCDLIPWPGVIATKDACKCESNYKRIWTADGPKCELCDSTKCNCGTKLNTNVPWIGRCIRYDSTNDIGDPDIIGTDAGADQTIVVNQLNAFPVLVSGLIKILMVLLWLLNFGNLIVGGIQMTIEGSYDDGFKRVKGVAIGLFVFGALGVVLYLVNPNFFT